MGLRNLIESALPGVVVTFNVGADSADVELRRPRGREVHELQADLVKAAPPKGDLSGVNQEDLLKYNAELAEVAAKWFDKLAEVDAEDVLTLDEIHDLLQRSQGVNDVLDALLKLVSGEAEVSPDTAKFRDGGS